MNQGFKHHQYASPFHLFQVKLWKDEMIPVITNELDELHKGTFNPGGTEDLLVDDLFDTGGDLHLVLD